ncbi:hypothetical protein GXW82_21080 [Streptacidiphilus sp. 4-A2]|nr:hypothetical protein [Streptacidiphilus sp. 4-A2]
MLGVVALLVPGSTDMLGEASKAGSAYFQALRAGDGTTACADMTRNAQTQFALEYRHNRPAPGQLRPC